MAMEWYIVHTYSGYEGKVKLALEKRIKDEKMDALFGEILVPQQQVAKAKKEEGGGARTSQQKLFPGYVMIQMQLTNESWHLVKDTPKVTDFLGGNKPKAVPESQVVNLREKLSSGAVVEKVEVTVEKGQNVRITTGPFSNFIGVVDDVKPDRQKVRVLVYIFGRSTPIDLDFQQIERIK
jgi:transcriptional antiterminator NusG